ncbi:hypothetical protein ACH5RR_015418 [Cinchona calisaya]|uniref:Uncharacterized protein n=1 Tax=Cinchona calisaya TaxID=153742 RepID=A0ABD2ZT61_9GENT
MQEAMQRSHDAIQGGNPIGKRGSSRGILQEQEKRSKTSSSKEKKMRMADKLQFPSRGSQQAKVLQEKNYTPLNTSCTEVLLQVEKQGILTRPPKMITTSNKRNKK